MHTLPRVSVLLIATLSAAACAPSGFTLPYVPSRPLVLDFGIAKQISEELARCQARVAEAFERVAGRP